jgi:hypothetical protein
MMESIPLIQFSPFCHEVATIGQSYQKVFKPQEDLDWMDPDSELTSKLYRSDEFSIDHDNRRHVLFSGCSVTYGTGLLLEETWAHQLWKSLGNTSGYFNIAMEGNNVSNMVFEIIKYCSIYGMPDTIILNLPDPYRSIQPIPIEGGRHRFIFERPISSKALASSEDLSKKAKLELSVFQSYKILELFCKSHGIDLYSFSWSLDTENILEGPDFSTFFKVDQDWIAETMVKYRGLHPDKKNVSLYARDPARHQGTAYHYAWYLFISNIVNNRR